MEITLLAVGKGAPGWVDEGFAEYQRRMPPHCRLRLKEIPPARRGRRQPLSAVLAEEGKRQRDAMNRDARLIALDERGEAWDTRTLSTKLAAWMGEGRDLDLVIGGADGLSPENLALAESSWSLSPLTLPHALVRVIVAEQLYRAWTILNGHPYHRG